jgi:hypothetical protein
VVRELTERSRDVYVTKEQRQRIIALVRMHAGVDCPTLEVEDIKNALGSVRVFYWCRKEDVGEREHLKYLTLTDEEAESIGVRIGVRRTVRRPDRDTNQ